MTLKVLTSRCLESAVARLGLGAVLALLLHAWIGEWPRLMDASGVLSFGLLTAILLVFATLLQRILSLAFRHEDRAPVKSLRFLWPIMVIALLFGLRAMGLFVFNSFGFEVEAEWRTSREPLNAPALAIEPIEPRVRGSDALKAVILPPLRAALNEAEAQCALRWSLEVRETLRSDVHWIPLYRGCTRSFQLVLQVAAVAASGEAGPVRHFERRLRLIANFRGLCDERTAETLIAEEARDRLVPALRLELREVLAQRPR